MVAMKCPTKQQRFMKSFLLLDKCCLQVQARKKNDVLRKLYQSNILQLRKLRPRLIFENNNSPSILKKKDLIVFQSLSFTKYIGPVLVKSTQSTSEVHIVHLLLCLLETVNIFHSWVWSWVSRDSKSFSHFMFNVAYLMSFFLHF